MKKIIILAVLALANVSCNRFLDIQPKGQVIARTIEDYDILLNGGAMRPHSIHNENNLALTGDNFKYEPLGNVDPNNPDDIDYQLYSFGSLRFANPSIPEVSWNANFANIYIFNKVINEVMGANNTVGYIETDKERVRAEAYFGRAVDYFYLVNTFAKHYSAENASSPAVPIILESDVTQVVGNRNTVGEVYDLIVKDLTAAIPHLPDNASNRTRPTKASGNAMLARVYLYMGNYTKALEHANNAIRIKGTLSNFVTSTTIPAAYEAEQYSYRYFGGAGGYPGVMSDNLKTTMDLVNDTRYSKFFMTDPAYGEFRSVFIWANQLPSVGEMYITRAEANARLGNTAQAIADLNALRNVRIRNHRALAANNFPATNDLVKFILEERRKELFFNHTRLFDVKRANLEPAFAKTVTHTFNGVNYTAEPNSNKLVLPIPASVLKFNPSWTQN